jgi:hypothetical protein
MRALLVPTAMMSCGIAVTAFAASTAHLPTVLLNSGLSDSTAVCWLVQPVFAKTARACAFDQTGYRFSDPPVGASDAKAALTDFTVWLPHPR